MRSGIVVESERGYILYVCEPDSDDDFCVGQQHVQLKLTLGLGVKLPLIITLQLHRTGFRGGGFTFRVCHPLHFYSSMSLDIEHIL